MLQVVLVTTLLGLLGLTPGDAQVPVQANFDASQFQGIWYVVGMASDDQAFLETKDNMKMPVVSVTAMADGNLGVKFGYPTPDGGCQQVDATFTKGSMNGQFSNVAMAQTDIRVANTDYKQYAVMFFLTDKGGVQNKWLQLYARTPELVPEGAQNMQMLSSQVGLDPSQGALLPKSDECANAFSQGPQLLRTRLPNASQRHEALASSDPLPALPSRPSSIRAGRSAQKRHRENVELERTNE
ncbi:PREDICTED: lipocalin-15-like [Chrysochloris asiatica]|uniref:Lipocalin-15-like n=1 Tax=Chrysochloris asiatica TaxID=185453 RepID=A0A9B0TLK7_CHRAS|nr:PREDICTED: lipocalin-15-like [Chrysochloris asiatica]